MINANDFYLFVKNSLSTNKNITFLQAEIIKINSEPKTLIETTEGQFEANEFIFDSVFRPNYSDKNNNNLWQHFKGYLIKTSTPTFNTDKPTLFDFRIDQQSECRFMYVLPTSETQALVEFTIFSEKLLEKNEYDLQIKNYLTNQLKLTDYEIVETEFGVIPMSDEHHVFRPANKVIRIGTAGGFVKASTGYSFQRTQVFLQKLVENLEKKAQNLNPIQESKWKKLLDSTLLNVMKEKRIPQDEIFTALFKNNKASRVLEFLNEETTLWQDIKLMNTVPKLPFIKSAVVEIKKLLLS